jgi:hypothetical protein
MELAITDIHSFQELYNSSFGIELDEDTAKETAQHLIQIMRLVYKPITKNEYNKLNGNYDGTSRSEKNL